MIVADLKPIYLDYNATTPLADEALAAMAPYLQGVFANASSSHALGRQAAAAVEHARSQVARLIGARNQEVVFTSGATESNNIAILGAAGADPNRRHVVTIATEHNAVLDPVTHLSSSGYDTTVLPVDRTGAIAPGALAESLRRDTLLVSAMAANNEVGTLAELEPLAELCRHRGVLFHTDAAQLAGKLPVDVQSFDIDLLSLSAHKLYGPKGVGALFIRRQVQLAPVLFGGGHERGLRSGTLNVPGVVGFGAAAALAADTLRADAARAEQLRSLLIDRLRAAFPRMEVNGHPSKRLPGTVNVRLPGIDADSLQAATPDVAISSGSACTSATPEPSHVLRAIGLDWRAAQECVRIGIGRPTTATEIRDAVDRLAAGAARLRSDPGVMK